jgi:hypothetical protein
MVFIAYILTSVIKIPMIYNYILLLVFTPVVTIIFCEIVRLIPLLRYLLFGIKNKLSLNEYLLKENITYIFNSFFYKRYSIDLSYSAMGANIYFSITIASHDRSRL